MSPEKATVVTGNKEVRMDPETAAAVAATRKGSRRGRTLWAWACLAPTFVFLLVFNYWPLLQTVYLSTQKSDLFGRAAGFVGVNNYVELFTDPAFGKTLLTTLVFVALSVAGKMIVCLALALPLSQRLRGTMFARATVLIPMAVSAAVAGLAFRAMMTPTTGILDQISVQLTGHTAGWLTSPTMAMVSIVIVDIWTAIGFVTLLLIAAIDAVPAEVLEASSIDGAGWWRRLLSVILPLITPTLFFVLVTQSMQAMREFTVISTVTGGGPGGSTTTLVFDLYQQAFGGTANYSASSAMGVILLAIIVVMTAVQFRFLERRVNY